MPIEMDITRRARPLDTANYEILRNQVLRRDGWRCQVCGSMTNLEVHHIQFRSRLGLDTED
jgi:5-methylcytosine-specific restriction endonuclease McrA